MKIEVKSIWIRSDFEVNLKWAWSEHEVKSKWNWIEPPSSTPQTSYSTLAGFIGSDLAFCSSLLACIAVWGGHISMNLLELWGWWGWRRGGGEKS